MSKHIKRSWIKAKNVPFAKSGTESSDTSVLQWNVLAMGLSWPSKPDSFVVESPDVLDWRTRSTKVIEGIIQSNCDLIGLQGISNQLQYFIRYCNSTYFPRG